MSIKVDMRLKAVRGQFFDSSAVIRKTNAVERRILSRFGAFVRRRSKSSIRSRKRKVSEPGNPPFSRKGTLKKLIFFSYDTNKKSVVIGPTKFGKGEAPRLLEEGGTATRQLLLLGKIQGRDDRGRFTKKALQPLDPSINYSGEVVFKNSKRGSQLRTKYRPRPFMGPAFNAELPSVRDQLANSIK